MGGHSIVIPWEREYILYRSPIILVLDDKPDVVSKEKKKKEEKEKRERKKSGPIQKTKV